MICSKCGTEYEGISCPKCDTPAILVNNSDYLKRRQAWEEKQRAEQEAAKKSQETKQLFQKKVEQLRSTDYKSVVRESSLVKRLKHYRRQLCYGACGILVLGFVVFILMRLFASNRGELYISSQGAIYHNELGGATLGNLNQTIANYDLTKLYFVDLPQEFAQEQPIASMSSSNGKFYAAVRYVGATQPGSTPVAEHETVTQAAESSTQAVAGTTPAATSTAQTTGTTQAATSTAQTTGTTQAATSTAQTTGTTQVAAAVVGEENSQAVNGTEFTEGTQELYGWKADGQSVRILAGSNSKTILYVSDEGRVVFTDTQYLNQGGVSSIALYVYDLSEADGKAVRIAPNIKNYYVFAEESALAYLDTEGNLVRVSLQNVSDKTIIASSLLNVYGAVEDSRATFLNVSGIVAGDMSVIYSTTDSKYYFTDMKAGKTTYLATLSDAAYGVVYEAKYNDCYFISANGLRRAAGITAESTEGVRTSEQIDSLVSISDCVYLDNENVLYYINRSNELSVIRHSKKDEYTRQVQQQNAAMNSLNCIAQDETAITYVADSKRYIKNDVNGAQTVIQNNMSDVDTSVTVTHRGNLYFVDVDDGILYRCKTNGSDTKALGNADNVWVGTVKNP